VIARPALAIVAAGEGDEVVAGKLARELQLPLAAAATDPATCRDFDILLVLSGPRLCLQQTSRLVAGPSAPGVKGRRRTPLPGPVGVDFGSENMRHRRRSGHNELLGKAVGVSAGRRPGVLDATAGLGRDGFVLADTGCAVTLCERHPVIAAMLAQGLRAALASDDDWLLQVVQRISLHRGDARTLAPEQVAQQQVIYLDPMFPSRDKSAAVKKEMALFQALLEGSAPDGDADDLLCWALGQDVARVVVKRPVRAPYLARRKPSHSLAGKAVRFDVYVRYPLE